MCPARICKAQPSKPDTESKKKGKNEVRQEQYEFCSRNGKSFDDFHCQFLAKLNLIKSYGADIC